MATWVWGMILYTVEKGTEKQAWCLPNNSQYQIPSSQNQWEPLEATGHLCSSTQDQMCLELNFSWNPRKPHFVPFLELVRSWTCSSLSSLWVLFQLQEQAEEKQLPSATEKAEAWGAAKWSWTSFPAILLSCPSHTAPGFPLNLWAPTQYSWLQNAFHHILSTAQYELYLPPKALHTCLQLSFPLHSSPNSSGLPLLAGSPSLLPFTCDPTLSNQVYTDNICKRTILYSQLSSHFISSTLLFITHYLFGFLK